MRDILLKYEGFMELLTYYTELCAKYPKGEVPLKSDLQPRDMIKILPLVSMTERYGDDDIRVRLTGTRLDRSFSKNLTGTNVMEYYSPKDRPIMRALHRGVTEGPYGAVSRVNLKLTDRSLNNCASIYLPFRNASGDVIYYLNMNSLAPLDPDQTDDLDPGEQQFTAKLKRASLFSLFDGDSYPLVKKLA